MTSDIDSASSRYYAKSSNKPPLPISSGTCEMDKYLKSNEMQKAREKQLSRWNAMRLKMPKANMKLLHEVQSPFSKPHKQAEPTEK